MIRRPPRSTQGVSSAASDVYKRQVNSVMGLLLAVESGVGLAALPEYLGSNSSNVIKVLPKSEGPITEAHFVYPQSLKNTARVQAFRNFLFSKIGDWK